MGPTLKFEMPEVVIRNMLAILRQTTGAPYDVTAPIIQSFEGQMSEQLEALKKQADALQRLREKAPKVPPQQANGNAQPPVLS